MNFHSYKVLEFDKLMESICEMSKIPEVQERFLALEPINNVNEVKKELEITRDFMDLLKYDGGVELAGSTCIKKYLEKTTLIGTYLDAEDIYRVKENLKVFRLAQRKFEDLEDKYKRLYNKFRYIPTYQGIEDLINKAINNDKKIKDDASLELRDIRAQKHIINENIKKKFDDMISSPSYAKAIQEKIVTQRDGRSVIPVKADFKGMIKGIEHDRSSSGQTVFIEPIAVVSLNNKMRELQVREREEIRKILMRLTDYIRSSSDGIAELNEAVLELDFLYSKSSYGISKMCVVPELNTKEFISLIDARHPFIPDEEIVPLTFELGRDYNSLLITGPNTGGKTVALKTAGLLTLMTLSGIPIPAGEKTSIGYFTGVFADIGDEQSIEQNLSSVSAHLKNVQAILENVTRSSLVLLDELGSGTDPMEGSAFAMAVIDYLKDKKCKSMISTHYSEVKAHGYNEPGIETASMEFNAETLSPTYRLLIGIPGESNALTIAKRLGVSDEIIERAKSFVSDENKKVEIMIASIKDQSNELEEAKLEVEKLKSEIERDKELYNERLKKLEKEKEAILKDAYEKADKMMKDMQAKARALIEKIQKEENKKAEVKGVQKSLNMLRSSLVEDRKKSFLQKPKKKTDIKVKEGDKVLVKSMSQHAIVLKVNKAKEQVQIQAGILKLMVPYDDIRIVKDEKKKKVTRVQNVKSSRVKSEIDLRGMMVEESLYELEKYLDSALLNGYNEVYIIHGKGTGQLRKGIHEYLKTCRYIKEYRIGNQNEGGLGCTVVTLK